MLKKTKVVAANSITVMCGWSFGLQVLSLVRVSDPTARGAAVGCTYFSAGAAQLVNAEPVRVPRPCRMSFVLFSWTSDSNLWPNPHSNLGNLDPAGLGRVSLSRFLVLGQSNPK